MEEKEEDRKSGDEEEEGRRERFVTSLPLWVFWRQRNGQRFFLFIYIAKLH